MVKFSGYALVLSALIALSGCGGGDGSSTASPAATATVKLSTVAKGSITSINGIQLTVQMPSGVTVKVNAQGKHATASGQFVGKDDLLTTNYLPPGNEPAKLNLVLPSAQEVSVGEFATFIVDIPAGVTVTKASFAIQDPLISYSPNTGSVDYVPAGQIVVEPEIVQ